MMKTETFILKLPSSGPFYCANRYTTDACQPDGITIVFAHCATAHKELYEPTIQELLRLQQGPSQRNLRIREIWSIDSQSHGASVDTNYELLRKYGPVSLHDYSELLHHLCSSEHLSGHHIVGVGDSASTSAWVLASKLSPSIQFQALVLLEPVTVTPEIEEEGKLRSNLHSQWVSARRNKWDDTESVTVWLKKRYPWQAWDSRVLEMHVKYGFYSKRDPDTPFCIIPRCSSEHELSLYEYEPHSSAGEELPRLCKRVPVHVVFAERPEIIPRKARRAICDSSAGRNMASVSVIPGTGHMAIMEKPELAANVIWNALIGENTYSLDVNARTPSRSNL
ncbi:hypothetical protein K435DRAFT_783264 [Dendrothele bispora CBS 962.96]|uniref:AB hydrolase-1 domain-containing protein n=1 Tax=Dendrothele bispora (strain CBS 962.96) TaxID=1314807 RepID=A0A4S8LB74_DENBC|nr:hypothetical protein K435DRAFT_783264 [Dendrothele bispora CBS 962.96]